MAESKSSADSDPSSTFVKLEGSSIAPTAPSMSLSSGHVPLGMWLERLKALIVNRGWKWLHNLRIERRKIHIQFMAAVMIIRRFKDSKLVTWK